MGSSSKTGSSKTGALFVAAGTSDSGCASKTGILSNDCIMSGSSSNIGGSGMKSFSSYGGEGM